MRNIQSKILLMFFVTGIIIILGMGAFSMNIISQSSTLANTVDGSSFQEIQAMQEVQMKQIKILILSAILVFSCIVSIMGAFVSKVIIMPIKDLANRARKIASGDNTELIRLEDIKKKKRGKSEVDAITNIIEIMTGELKQNLTDVNRQKREIEAILLHMTDGVIAFDENGKVMHINPAAKQLLDISDKQNNFEKIFSHIDETINMERLIYLEDWTTSESKVQINDKYLKLFFAPFKDENNRPSGIIVLIQDITEHVKLDNMRKEFIADVSHELKTPLTSIMGYAETLSEMEYDKEIQDKFLNVITTEAVRMTKLVNDLLTLSKHDDTNTKWEKTEFDLGELVKKCQEYLQIEMEKKHQKVECFVTANVPNVYADKDGIERVVLNILSNSVKYTRRRRNNKNICWLCI